MRWIVFGKRRSSKFERRIERQFFLYISPWLIGFAAFTLVPMIMSLIYSFTDVIMATANTAPLNFVGLKNFADLFIRDSDFMTSIGNTAIMAVMKVLFGTAFALLIAILLNRQMPGKKIYRTLIYLPAVIPVVAVSLLWKLIFTGEMNIVNYILSLFGIGPVDFFGSGISAKATVIFIGVWGGLGPNMFIFLAALQGVPQDIIEASELDGAGAAARFWHIIVPTVSPTIFFVALTGMISALQSYADVKLLTNGGPGNTTMTMNMLIVRNAFNSFGRKTLGYASAQAWFVFVVVMTLTVITNAVAKKREKKGE